MILVTNTESTSTSKPQTTLQASSLLAFEQYTSISRRYIFQSISKVFRFLSFSRSGYFFSKVPPVWGASPMDTRMVLRDLS